jgi:hypothetical protein
VVVRPPYPFVARPDSLASDGIAAKDIAEYFGPQEEPLSLALDLTSAMHHQQLRFPARAARDPEATDERRQQALLLGAPRPEPWPSARPGPNRARRSR